ncbi:unnamed protein product [Timema podura]|uniref:Uncharacterized protein n=1 Tax=Timema podura TaxID=61482 RepID=A0ABN7PCY1_TIMPD|nr:unnamed protein product [Timema podura]
MVLPFQAGSQHQYDRWVKVLAVELLRQTSLEDIKFLDILAITATLGQAQEERGRARSRGVQSRRSHLSPGGDREVAALLAKCQQVESYVSVREKRRLFESLSLSNQRLAQSTDNLYTEELVSPEICGKKRAHSLHDLSRSSVAVKEMCRYFEERGRQDNVSRPNNVPELNNAFLSRRNAQRWERRLTRLKQQVTDSEDRIWRLQGKMAGLDQQRESTRLRGRDVRGYSVLERRLTEEEAKLNQLHEGASRALREVEHSSAKFETALIQ